MFNSRMYWRIWIIIGILIFIAMTLIKGLELNLVLITTAISSAGISLLIEALLFKQFIWKKTPGIFYPWLCSIPFLGGKWEGTIQSDYVFPDTMKKGEPIPAKMSIKHEFDKITVTLDTGKSYSSSYVSDIWIDEADRKYLCYTYYNDADENRDKNPNHDGTAKLRISKDDNGELILEGHYFTGRKTSGKMIFKRINQNNSQV
ncbi:Cap15 family cyclic dinucleotide receptor domain-containing protein [Bacillus toyonensis]